MGGHKDTAPPKRVDSARLSLAILGPAGVGKTALAMSLKNVPFSPCYDPTVEDQISHDLTVQLPNHTILSHAWRRCRASSAAAAVWAARRYGL
jgi:GTPase SAR1 family protein